MLRAGVSFAAVIKLLGHKSSHMTLEYFEITQQDLQREFHLAISHPRHLVSRHEYATRCNRLSVPCRPPAASPAGFPNPTTTALRRGSPPVRCPKKQVRARDTSAYLSTSLRFQTGRAGAGGVRSPETVPISSDFLGYLLLSLAFAEVLVGPPPGPLAAPSRLYLEIRAAPDPDAARLLPVGDHGGIRGRVKAGAQIAYCSPTAKV
jgi:hypothetical protein